VVGRHEAAVVRHHAAMLLDGAVGSRTPALLAWGALGPRGQSAPLAALDALLAFRALVPAAFGRRADALFELMEALASAGPVASPVHLSLEPVHRRGWGSCYAALNHGEIPAEAIEALLAQHPLAEAAGGPLLYGVDTYGVDTYGVDTYGVDTSVWPRCDAETSPERGFYHHSPAPAPLDAPLGRPAHRRRLVVPMGRPTQPDSR
jgi:DDE superfamily endonuclease